MFQRDPRKDKIEKELWLALHDAMAEYDRALSEFQRMIAEVPSGLPSPDGTFRIEKASASRRRAFENYRQAMKQFSDFILGRPPDEPGNTIFS